MRVSLRTSRGQGPWRWEQGTNWSGKAGGEPALSFTKGQHQPLEIPAQGADTGEPAFSVNGSLLPLPAPPVNLPADLEWLP